MHPTQPANQLLFGDVQLRDGAPAQHPAVPGRSSTACPRPGPSRRETLSSMRPPDSAKTAATSIQVGSSDFWRTAQQMTPRHQRSSSDVTRCAHPQCDQDLAFPCVPARTAVRLAAAAQAPWHHRFTASLEAQPCEMAPVSDLLADAAAMAERQQTADAEASALSHLHIGSGAASILAAGE